MTEKSSVRIGPRFATLTLLVGLFSLLLTHNQASAAHEDPDVDTFAAYEYRVDLAQSTVTVTIELAVTADKPNRSLGDGSFYEYYFPGYFLAVPRDAVDLAVTDPVGRQLDFSIDNNEEGFSIVEVDFGRNIFYRQTADVVVTYRLPEGVARSRSLTRVNDAYIGFAIWLTPQIESASVTVVSPPGFEDRSAGSTVFETTVRADETEFVATDIDPADYWALVSLARDESLVVTELLIEGHPIKVSAWPGDEAWAEHVTTNLEEGLPVLIDTVGLPWPVDDELTVIESYSPYLLGYAGWYDPTTDEIEIGDELDSHLVFHELSHVWFNHDLFLDRWITEGLSDVFGAAVVESLGEDRPNPPPTSLIDAAAQPLNEWRRFDPDPELEGWSYDASWTVTEAILEQVGIEVLSEVIQAAANNEIAYLGDGDPEPGATPIDWRDYLDLIENRGAVADDSVVDLFNDWIVPPLSRQTMAVRSERRSRYAEVEAAGDTWAPPHGLRQAMSAWEFGDAADLMDEAEGLLERRELVNEVLKPLDASLPPQLEIGYEAAKSDLGELSTLMAEVETTADGLRHSHAQVEAVSGPLRWVGALGTNYRADLDAAIASFEQGDLDEAMDGGQAVDAGVEKLQRRGLILVIIAVAVLALLLGLLGVLLARRRRKESEPNQPDSASGTTTGANPDATPPLEAVGEAG